ncbi:hypothetical protein [Virgibacillus kimchii]
MKCSLKKLLNQRIILNAIIEEASTEEHRKGFAVVANEVRNWQNRAEFVTDITGILTITDKAITL